MRKFILKSEASLAEQDFIDYPAWAEYYEPDDIETLGGLGFDVREVRERIAHTGYSDEYFFALPKEGCSAPFHFLMMSLRAVTPGGITLVGYSTDACLAVFHNGILYSFNRRLRERSLTNSEKLADALGEQTVFPLLVKVVANSKEYEYAL